MQAHINDSIRDLVRPIAGLTHYDGNARTHDLQLIASSLKTNGQYRPIVVRRDPDDENRNDVVLAGNGTLTAARDILGWETIAVTYVECDDAQARKIVLIDNRANDVSSYDEEALARLLEEVQLEGDWQGSGFDQDYLDSLHARLADLSDLPDALDLDRDHGDGGDSTQMARLTVGKVKITLTDDEVALVEQAYDDYLTEYGTVVGFVGALVLGWRKHTGKTAAPAQKG